MRDEMVTVETLIAQKNTPGTTSAFQPVDQIASQDLYIKITKGRIVRVDRTSITVGPYSTASTRTYFGRFPAAYFQRWTELRSLTIKATVSGRGRLRAYASDDIDRERIIGVADVDYETPQETSIPVVIDRFLDGGFIWVDIESGDAPLHDMGTSVSSPQRRCPCARSAS